MTPKEMKFAAALLEMAADEFYNNTCNDMDMTIFNKIGYTDEEKTELALEFWKDSGDLEEMKNEPLAGFHFIGDASWMSFMEKKLILMAESQG